MKGRPFFRYVLIESVSNAALVGSIASFFLMILAAAGKVAGPPVLTPAAHSFISAIISRGSSDEVPNLMATFIAGPSSWLILALVCSTVSKLLFAVLRGLAERERQLQERDNNIAA